MKINISPDARETLAGILSEAISAAVTVLATPVLTDAARVAGFRELDLTEWPEIRPWEPAEIMCVDGDFLIGSLAAVRADHVLAWRPLNTAEWKANTGWPDVSPDTVVRIAKWREGTDDRPAREVAWGSSTCDCSPNYWRADQDTFDLLFFPAQASEAEQPAPEAQAGEQQPQPETQPKAEPAEA